MSFLAIDYLRSVAERSGRVSDPPARERVAFSLEK